MTNVFTNTINTAGDGIDLTGNISTLFVAAGVTLAGEGFEHNGVNYTGGGALYSTIAGNVSGDQYGINAGTSEAILFVEKSASVNAGLNGGGAAIYAGSGALTNDGTIAGGFGVYFNGNAVIHNTGTIECYIDPSIFGTAISITDSGPGRDIVGNSGTISAALAVQQNGNAAMTVTNSGEIASTYSGVKFASASTDILNNSGNISNVNSVTYIVTAAVQEAGSGTLEVTNSGNIQSAFVAIDDSGPAHMNITNTSRGLITGPTAIQYNGASGSTADILTNDGSIQGKAFAVVENGSAVLNIVNDGTITGNTVGIQFNGAATFTDTLDNSGTIRTTLPGGNAIVENGGAALNLTNAGRIVGNVVFGTGGGTYDGTQGHVTGAVEGGATGNDTFKGGNGDEHFIGGGGNDVLKGGAGDDVLQGNAGHDNLYGGQDSDTFVYLGSSDSHGASSHDTVFGFDATQDKFDLDVSVNKVEAAITTGSLSNATFGADMADLLTTAHLHAHHAILVTADAGDLAGQTFLIVDHNHTAGYQSADYVIALSGATNLASLGVDNFM